MEKIGCLMHLYWRIQQDLNCLGETIQFHEPGLIRSHKEWVRRNIAGIILAEDIEFKDFVKPGLN